MKDLSLKRGRAGDRRLGRAVRGVAAGIGALIWAQLALADTTTSPVAADAPATPPASVDAPSPAAEPLDPLKESPGGIPRAPVLGDPIIVTASRLPERPLRAPYTVDVISDQQFRDKGFRSAPDALSETPGILVQKTSYGQGSPFIRGFTGFRTLLLVDGIRLNNSVFREGPNQYFNTIDPLSVERFEVVKGPGSVLYGSDAIGGTVNAITKSPYGYGQGTNFGASLYQRGSSAERSYTVHPEAVVTFGERVGVYGGGSYKEFGDLEGGRDIGTQDYTGYDEWDADVKVEYFLTENQRLVVAHQRVQQHNVPRTHSTVFGVSFDGTSVGSDLIRELDQYRDLTYVQYHADNLKGPISNISAGVSWHHQYEREDRVRGSGASSTQEVDVGSLGLTLQLTSPSPIGELTYGVEYYRDFVSSSSTSNPIQGPVADDANYDLLGIYLQDRIPIGERFELTLGGRFTYAAADAGSVEDPVTGNAISIDDDWTSVVGSIRGNYFIVPEHLTVYGGVSQGFRAPNLSDLTRLDIARSNELEIPTPDLDPEEFTSYEIGFKGSYEDFGFQAAYFFTDINDMIVRRPTGQVIGGDNVVTKSNAGDGYVQGIELGLSYRFHPDFTFFSAGTWQDGEVDQFPTSAPTVERQPVSRLIPVTGLFGLRWDDPTRRFFVEGSVQVVASQTDLSFGDIGDTQRIPPGGTPSYELYHLRTGWTFNEHARLTFAIENILDEDYRVHGSGSNGPGRNFILGLELRY